MSKGVAFKSIDGSALRIGIVRARWNGAITDALLEGCLRALKESGVREENVIVRDVPGSYEAVYGAKRLIETEKPDAVVCLGTLIKGETMHFEYIADAVTQGIMRLNLDTGTPVIFGILTCLTEEQAIARSRGENNHGYWWGKTAAEMGLLKKR